MATFSSGVKILSQISKAEGCKTVCSRSYSDDRTTSLYQHHSPDWTTHETRTSLHSSKSWFSLFRRKKSPENKVVQQESCDLKTPEDDSWLSFFKKKVSKEKPPLTSCRIHQARLRKEEEQKALEEGREPEEWKPDVTIVTEESGNPVICKTPLEPQPQPPPQPPLPCAVEVMKKNAEKTAPKSEEKHDLASSKNLFNMRLPYEEFKIPIVSKPSQPVSSDNLQPRKQSPFVSSDKFTAGATFQPSKKFHKQSNLESIPITNIPKSKYLQNSNIIPSLNKGTIRVKSQKFSNKNLKFSNKNLQSPCKNNSSKISKTPIIFKTNTKKSDKVSAKQQSVPKILSAQYDIHNESNQLLSKPTLQKLIMKDDATGKIQRFQNNIKDEIIKTRFQNEPTKVISDPAKLAKTLSVTDVNERQLTLNISQATKNLQKLTEKLTVKEKHSTKKQEECRNKNKTAEATAKKFNFKQDIPQKKSPTLEHIKTSRAKFVNLKIPSLKIPLEKGIQENVESTNISLSLPNINEHRKHSNKATITNIDVNSIKSLTALSPTSNQNDYTKALGKVSQVNINVGSPNNQKIKQSREKTKMDNKNPVRPHDESFLSTWKQNYSYLGISRNVRKAQNKNISKLSSKGNKEIQSLLPSNSQPFIRHNEGMQTWNKVISKDLISIRKKIEQNLKKTPKSLPKDSNEYPKEPWFIECQKSYVDMEGKDAYFIKESPYFRENVTSSRKGRLYENLTGDQTIDSIITPSAYAKILGYGNRSVLESRIRDSSECKKEQFSTFSSPRTNEYNNPLPKVSKLHTLNSCSSRDNNIKVDIIKSSKIKHNGLKNSTKKNISEEIKFQRQKSCTDDALYSELSIPHSAVFVIGQTIYNNNKYKDSMFPADSENCKTCSSFDNYTDPCIQDKSLEPVSKSSMIDTPKQSKEGDSIIISSLNTNPESITSIKNMNKHIPFSYEKSYEEWCAMESGIEGKSAEVEKNNPLQETVANGESFNSSLPKSCTSKACSANSKCLTNQIVKRTFSNFMDDPLWPLYRESYKCAENKIDSNTRTISLTDDKQKTDSAAKKDTKTLQICDKHPAPGCKIPQNTDCKQKPRTHSPCDVRPAPKPSYSECLKGPTPGHLFTECDLKNETSCPPKKKVKSYDGCSKKTEKEELVCPDKPLKKKKQNATSNRKGKTDDCDTESGVCEDTDKFKLQSGCIKFPMKCNTWNFVSQQRFYSLFHFNTIHYSGYEKTSKFSIQSQYLKHTYSCSSIEPFQSRDSIQCKTDENVSSPPTTDRSCRKISEVQQEQDSKKSGKTCENLKMPGCRTPEFTNCKEQEKRHLVETCTKIYPPEPSFSECIRDPPPEIHMTECGDITEQRCPEPKRVKSYDGCNPPAKKEIPCPPPRKQEQPRNKTDCEENKGKLYNDEPTKRGMPTFSKPPMKCSSNQYFVGHQIQMKQPSQSYCNLNSLKSYESRHQFSRHASSSNFIDPPIHGNKSHMECSKTSDSKSGSSFIENVGSGVKKEKKSDKTCEKHHVPGCKIPDHTDCKFKPKELIHCKKRLAPKLSYSECIREHTPPHPFTECNLKTYEKCPNAKEKIKSYDGCKEKDKYESVVCPESPPEEKLKPSEKKKGKLEKCENDNCSNVEPFKFKTGYSKPPMKCLSLKISQHCLPPIRSYSDVKTENKVDLHYRSLSYTDRQIKVLRVRAYSEDQKSKPKSKKSKYETVPCPDDPNPPCRPKEEDKTSGKVLSTKCRDAIVPTKHFIECKAPPKKRVFKCEQPKIVIKVTKKVQQEVVKVEKPKPKTYVECPKPIPKRTGSLCDVEKPPPPPPPPKNVCPIIDKHFVECLKPPPKIQPTCEQPLIYKKEEKPPPRIAGICRGDHLVKTFKECPKPPPRKKGIICDGPYQPRIEPCIGQVKIKKGDKVSRKKCGVDPDDKTPACPEKKKKDERRKCSQNSIGTSITFPPPSAGSTMKYSTSQATENQKFTKNCHIPVYFSNKNVITMMKFSSPRTSVNKDINKNIPVMFPTSSAGITLAVSAHKTNENKETLKKCDPPAFAPIRTGAIVNFSTSISVCKDDSNLCKKKMNEKDSLTNRKCDSESTISPTTKQCKPLEKIKMTCEAMTDKLEVKENMSYRIPDITKKQDVHHKTECTTAIEDGAIKDLLITIKSWFSLLKAREGCQPGTKWKKNMPIISACEPKSEAMKEKQLKVEKRKCSSMKPKKKAEEKDDKIKVEINAMGNDCPHPPNKDGCPNATLPGCRVPECTNCSKQIKTTEIQNECKKIPAPKPSFSERTKELLSPHRFTECYTPVDVKCKTDIAKSECSACEMYFQKNKIKMPKKLTVAMKLDHPSGVESDKDQAKLSIESQPSKENPICQKSKQLQDLNCEDNAPCNLTPVEKNIFYRLLNKKSKLPECQTKDNCEPLTEAVKECEKLKSNICQVSKDQMQKCGKNHSSNEYAKLIDCRRQEFTSKTIKDDNTLEILKIGAVLETTEGKVKNILTTSTSVSIKEDEKKGSETVRVDKVCVPHQVPILKSKKASECNTTKGSCKKISSSKTIKSTSNRTEASRNKEQHSKKSMFCSGNLQIQERSNSTSPVNKDLVCNINNKNVLPYQGLNIDISSEINLKPSSSISKKLSLQRVPLKIKTIPNKLKIKKSFKGKYSIDRVHNISEKMKYKNRSTMSTKSRKTSCRSKSHTKSVAILIKNDTGDKILSEQKSQNNLTENSKQKQTDDTSYLAYVKKFPGMVRNAVLTDIWSYCQKDLPVHSILKVPDPIYSKPNPKLDFPHLFESSVFLADGERECEENDAGKVSSQDLTNNY